jgi:2-oxo-3-hexenedioate decarboxylase
MIEEGGSTHHASYVHPRVEPELAFHLRRPLRGKISLAEAVSAVEAVSPAVEVIDSRYRDFKFALTDVVADNSSASAYVLGTPCSPNIDLTNLGMILSIDGAPRQIGSSAAILGNPWRSLVAAAAFADAHGFQLEAGNVVLAGAATEAVAVDRGARVTLETAGMATLQFSFDA